jgi:hypothetical protein
LDAQNAWANFGGLNLLEAKARFRENPLCYQEDFMFMGGKAFAYYFPVIEEHLRSAPAIFAGDNYEAGILPQCIGFQFDGENLAHARHLGERVIELADYVRGNILRFGENDEERQDVAHAWAELVHLVRAATGR